MQAWRRVEVAACEAMDGPTAKLEAIRAATFTVQAVQEREATTDHDVAGCRCAQRIRGRRQALDPLRSDSSDVLATATALQLRPAGKIVLHGAREYVDALTQRARDHVDTFVWGARTASTPSQRRSA